jgi:putative tryptophan/tyrosine transport system substrate-binding protein
MRRREVIGFLGTVGLWSFAARAQQPSKMKRVAIVHPATKPDDMRIGKDPNYSVIFEEMQHLGYVEGANLIVERYSAEGRFDRYPEIARGVVATRPDVIFAFSNLLVLALQSETRTIPIVAWTGDPVAAGIVSSLARPGGNVTGVSTDAGAEIGAKRLELLAEAVGKLTNVRVLAPPALWEDPQTKATREAAEKMNIPLRLEPLQSPINDAEYRRAFDAMQRDHVDGVWISPTAENYTYRVLLGRLAQEFRIPAICVYNDSVDAGALMSYAFDLKTEDRSPRRSLKFSTAGIRQRCRFFRKAIGSWSSTLRRPKSLASKYLQGWSHELTE